MNHQFAPYLKISLLPLRVCVHFFSVLIIGFTRIDTKEMIFALLPALEMAK